MKIIIDCFGADNSPQAQVGGAISALKNNGDVELVLVGKKDLINAELLKYDYDKTRVEVLNADTEIGCDEKPTSAIREKSDSSLVVALDYLKNNDDAAALISSGSTGAILTGGILKIGRIKGISRPALAPILPTMTGNPVMLVDCGANVDCKPIQLLHFAHMGAVYFREVLGVNKPKVAVLSNGTEAEKGTELSKAAFALIQKLPNIEFVGNMEARDLLSGKIDIVVADGFSGNIALKASEGAIMLCLKTIKKEIKSSFISKLGTLLMRKQFKSVKKKMDYSNHGGAIFLGTEKIIIKAHGSANNTAVEAAVLQAVATVKVNVVGKIKAGLSEVCEE